MSDTFRPRLNLLTAYPYHKPQMTNLIAEMGEDCRWLLDSGAFTAWKSGNPIPLDNYCNFISALPVPPWRYFNLDVIGDAVATRRNYDTMLDRGFRPVPVFTRGGSLDELDRYYETSDVVALGGLAGTGQQPYGYVKAVMQHVAGRRVHILGFTAMNWIKHLRPYSCDASSWTSGSRFGNLQLYIGQGRFQNYSRKDVSAGQPSVEALQALRTIGVDPFHLAQSAAWTGGASFVEWVGAATWARASVEIERNLGTKLFIAMATNRAHLMRAGFQAAIGRARLDDLMRDWQAAA